VAAREAPGSTPTVHFEDTDKAYEATLAAGAESVDPPRRVMEGVRVAMVRAPGGVLIGSLGQPTDPSPSRTPHAWVSFSRTLCNARYPLRIVDSEWPGFKPIRVRARQRSVWVVRALRCGAL